MKLLTIILLVYSFNSFYYPQNNSNQNSVLLFSTIDKLEKSIIKTNEDIRRYEKEISTCDNKIATSEKIIKLAQEQGNTNAEKVARDAVKQSYNAKDKNIKLMSSAKLRKKQFETILSSLRKENLLQKSNTTAALIKYSGEISVQKSSGEQFKINENNFSLLENGDIISTAKDSKIELKFLEGRGDLVLGENSRLKFSDNDSTNVVEMINGKAKMLVQKADEFEKELRELYDKYKQAVVTAPETYEQFVKRWRNKFEVRRPGGGCGAIRGTEFIINSKLDKSFEIFVLEGSIEMISNDNEIVLINTGEKGIIDEEGILHKPVQIDINNFEKWWEEEK